MVGRELPPAGAVKFDTVRSTDHDGYTEFAGLIRNTAEHEELPAILLMPAERSPSGPPARRTRPAKWFNRVAVWIDADGKADLYSADGKLKPAVKTLVESGTAVIGVDLI